MARSVLVTTQKPEQQPKRSLISNGKVVQTTPEQQLSDAYDAAVSTPVLDKATAGSDMNFFQKAWGLFENAGAAGIGGLRNIINDAGYRSQAAAPLLAGDDAYYKAMWEQTTGKQNTGVKIPEDTRTPEQRELDEYMGLGPSYTPEARAMAQAIKASYKKLDETGVTRTTSLGDKYAQEVAEKYAGAGDKWQRAYGISQSAGQQVLPMAAKYIPVVGPLLSSLMFFGQASGGATDEALADGADWDKALTYGTAIGGIEAGTEALGDLGKKAVISTLGKSASTGSFGKALAGVLSNNNAVRTLLGVLGNATSEGGEEVLSDLISPFAKSIYNDKSLGENWRDEVTVQKLWDDFLGGFAVGGLMDGARALTGGYRGQNQNYQNETVNQAIQDARTAAKEHGIFSDESIAATMEVAQAIETLEGQQAIAAQDANRYRQIVNEMKRAQNGDIGAQERLTALLATEASRNREDGAQFPADINALVAAQRRAYIEEQTQADPEKAAAAQEILERYGVDLPEAQTDIMTVERFAEIDNARAGRTAGQEQAQPDLSQTAAPASPAETTSQNLPLNAPVNTEVTPSAAQTMARAAQNTVQESAPARTDISPAAQTMADILTGKPAEAESAQTLDKVSDTDASAQGGEAGQSAVRDNIPPQPQKENGTPSGPDTPTRLSQTVETVRDAGVTTEEVRQDINTGIEDGKYRYIPESNADAVSSVRSAIAEKGYESVLRDWTADVRSGKTSNDLAATGAVLYNEAVQSGNTRLALDILTDYQLLGTNTAQGLQAMRIIKDLTPQDRMYMVKKSIDKLYDNLSDGTKKKLPDGFNINEELLDRFVNAPDAKSESEAMQDIQTDIARQVPHTFMDRLTALRYLNMLGNFRTQIRNLAGNTGMGITAGVKNTVRYTLERAAEAVTGGKYQRNTSLTVSPEMMKAARADYDTNADFVNGDAKYNDSMSSDSFARGVRDAQRPFTSENKFANALMKPLDLWSRGTNWAMTKGDTVFIKQQYARYLGGYLEAHKMNADTFAKIVSGDIQPTAEQLQTIDNGRLFAAKEAQEATFHDTNAFSSWVSQIGRKPGTPWYGRLIGEGIAPFRKTPANVAVRAVEYSPLGFFDTVNKAVQAARGKNGVSGSDVINSLSKSLTGTGLFALGMMLRDAGWLRGTEDDEKQEAFDKLQGQQDYSLVLPDGTNVTMDWLSPAAIPMFMGVALMDEIDDGEFAVSDVLDVITRLSDPMIQMSMLQGVNDTLDSVKYSGNSLGQVALNTMLSYAMQGLTNTMFGQAERTFEDRRYSTFLDADTPTGKTLQSKLGKALAKIPGIDYNQVEYVDAWGRTEYSGGLGARAFENFLSPGYLSKQNSTEVDSELQRLYDAGQTNVFPSRIAMSQTVNVYNNQGKKLEERSLTPDEYVQFQKVMGQTSLEMVKDLMKSPVYKGMSDASKAEAISDIYSYAKDMAAMTVEPSEKLARQSDVSGLSNPAAYYAALASFGTASKDSDNRNYSELDALMSSFKRLPSDVQSAVTDKNSNFAKVYDAKENGFTSQQYFRVYDAVKDLTPAEGYSGVATWQKVSAICTMNTSDKEKDYFVGNYFSGGAYDRYLTAREAGFSPASVAVAYQTYQLSKGVDKNGDGRNDSGTKKAAFIAAMMEQGASRKSAEWLYKLFASNK